MNPTPEMVAIFFEDGEDACRGFVAVLAGGDGGDADAHAVAINGCPLPAEVDIDEHRSVFRDLRRPDPFAGLQCLSLLGELKLRRRRRALREQDAGRPEGKIETGGKHHAQETLHNNPRYVDAAQ